MLFLVMTQDERIAQYIWHESLQKSIKPLSWGISLSTIKVIESGTAFRIRGKFNGVVKILYNQKRNIYKVMIKSDFENKPIVYKNVLLKNLVPVIDQVITHASKYQPVEFHKIPNMQERMAV
jgi:hypothetical protein